MKLNFTSFLSKYLILSSTFIYCTCGAGLKSKKNAKLLRR